MLTLVEPDQAPLKMTRKKKPKHVSEYFASKRTRSFLPNTENIFAHILLSKRTFD